nr:MAG TPA: hypothetical protein [Caudoviricetes sp.]
MIVPCFFCSFLLGRGRGIISGTFRLLQKARSFHPASVFFLCLEVHDHRKRCSPYKSHAQRT